MSVSDIFISYSREDATAARRFAKCLTDEGYRVWWDAALHSGETFDEVIEQQLRGASAVVVLWSPRSVKSRWVRAEATLADRRNKLVPVIIEACERPIIFELAHTINLSHWEGSGEDPVWQNLLVDLRHLVARSPDAAKVPSKQEDEGPPAPSNAKTETPSSTEIAANNQASPPAEELEEDEEYQPTQFFTPVADISETASHWLLHQDADRTEMQYVIGPEGLKFGRSLSADVVLHDAQISRTHCSVQLKEGELHVVDLNSTNGTFVDDERIGGEAVLPVGSTLRIGAYSLVHEVRPAKAADKKSSAVG